MRPIDALLQACYVCMTPALEGHMGSIEPRERKGPNGKPTTRYRARVRIDGEVSQDTFDRKRDAEAWITEQEAAKLTGTAVSSRRGRVPYSELLDEWLASRARRGAATGKPAPSTLARDKITAETHLRPTFGREKLATIRRAHVQDWVDGLADHLAPATVTKVYTAFALTMKEAVKREYLAGTPCTEIDLPAGQRTRMRFLDERELEGLADAMDLIAPPYHALILVLGWGGLRLGEAIALTPDDVDTETGTLHVTKSVTMVDGRPLLRDEPKTSAGRRYVDLMPSVAEELADHLGRWSTPYLVFPPPADARHPESAREAVYLQHGNFRRRYFQKAVERAQEDGTMKPGLLRIHDLRHTAISLRYRYDPGNHLGISRWAGHAKVQFTMDRYGQVYRDAERESMAKGDAFRKAAHEPTNVIPLRASGR